MRVDKYLKNSRIIKRRTVAKEACEQGRVSINGQEAKPGTEVKVGDVIELSFGNKGMKVQVEALLEHAPKDQAQTMYKIIE